MARSSHSRKSRDFLVCKPLGHIAPRVQAIGPERFGVVCVDCAKLRSKFFLCDFFGKVLLEPTILPHTQPEFNNAIQRIRSLLAEHACADSIVAIERTGIYHRPVQQAFRQAGFEIRLVHPFASKQYRQVADPGNKTDDTDLAAIFRAAVNGFGLLEPVWPDPFQQLQCLIRQRRDLVQKSSLLRCQIHQLLCLLMPGYVESFNDHFFDSPIALFLAQQTGSAKALLQMDLLALQQLVQPRRCRTSTLARILDWARSAPPEPHPQTPILLQSLKRLEEDRSQKTKQITALEAQIAHVLCRTGYTLLLALPGINVVGASELAGELGPIEHYADANRITGRAGLAPSRYQSDQVDRANGPLRRRANRRIRHALLQAADNLIRHNHYYLAKADRWRRDKKSPGWIHVKIAKSFSRLLFVLLSNRCLYPHPACQARHYILDKLMAFHRDHDTPMSLVMQDLEEAARHFPKTLLQEEGQALKDQLKHINERRRGPVPLASLIPQVLARLGLVDVQSKTEDLG
jgi:transposase